MKHSRFRLRNLFTRSAVKHRLSIRGQKNTGSTMDFLSHDCIRDGRSNDLFLSLYDIFAVSATTGCALV